MILIGTDEAGYGPNLGPLVVSASTWTAPSADLSPMLEPLRSAGLPFGDSKKLFHGGGSLAPLERSVLSALYSLGIFPENSREIGLSTLSPDCSDGPVTIPTETNRNDLAGYSGRFRNILSEHRIELLDLRAKKIYAAEFNSLVAKHDSKGALLSEVTTDLAFASLSQCLSGWNGTTETILILCDKHGGRNRYLDLLLARVDGEFVQTIRESRAESVYRSKYRGHSIEFRFLAKGESHVPIALASMLSKYLRELAMLEFNAFWQNRIPGLRKTAGYPEDAKRFKADIASVQAALNIEDNAIWRNR